MDQAVPINLQQAHLITTCNNNRKAGSRIQNQYVRLILLPQNNVEVSQVLELKPASEQNAKLPEKSNLPSSVVVAPPLHDKDINPVLLMKYLLSLKSLTSQALSLKCSSTSFCFFPSLTECSQLGKEHFSVYCCLLFAFYWDLEVLAKTDCSQQAICGAKRCTVV